MNKFLKIGEVLGQIVGALISVFLACWMLVAIGFAAHGVWFLLWHGWCLFKR